MGDLISVRGKGGGIKISGGVEKFCGKYVVARGQRLLQTLEMLSRDIEGAKKKKNLGRVTG